MKYKRITDELKLLPKLFVVAPIKKASGNVVFFHQRYYAQVLINELGLNNVNIIASTNMKATKTVAKIVSDDTSFL